MNKQRRKEIGKAIAMVEDAISILMCVQDEEQEAYDNLPESLQETENGEKMQEWVDKLSMACDELQNTIDELQE